MTEAETADMDRFVSLGVITGKPIPDKARIDSLFSELSEAFQKDAAKDDIVRIIGDYLPNFEHIEKGRSLDSKM